MDVEIRELERKANSGDREAAKKLQALRIRAGAPEIGNSPAVWKRDYRDPDNVQRYIAPGYATYAYVTGPLPKYDDEDIDPDQEEKRWRWKAGVMVCMYPADTPDERKSRSIRGYATTEAGAKRIVEVICQETGTCLPR
jgi:hypothetical protein